MCLCYNKGMDSISKLDAVFDYIESNLCGQIKIDKIAQLMCENKKSAESIFKFFTGITIKEYFKNRKLSMAGLELIKGEKVIDVAVKFGYSSSQSFARAFNSFFGFNPGEVRQKNRTLKLFAPFVITLSFGSEPMEYKIVDQPERTLYAVMREEQNVTTGKVARAFWKSFDKSQIKGEMYGLSEMKDDGRYWIASDKPFVGSQPMTIKASKFAVFTFDRDARVENKISNIIKYWLDESGVEFNKEFPILEKYNIDSLEIYYAIKF